ncbi:helix-turn-helix domain-containing protein [Actinomycetospora cinnamomea]|uniref:Helix-turn-helix protein n=1 Tax=Actinomycetospora cinnamomea TaxID=663609 RepID=A0A2U1EVI9_9PSEU|nr:helix-turn-helix domain-containing protein [Actinomycetospora cinnamomea]PVZ03946.1 helix-turn-helix protein [Actinomycetospora cinnamomea]
MGARPDLLMHPVRMRIVRALLGDRTRTTAQLHHELPDVPAATLYRQIARLVEGEALEVVAERRIRGAVERTYALREGAVDVGREDAARMDAGEVREAFTAFLAGLSAGFEQFVDDAPESLEDETFGFRSAALWLTDEETERLVADLRSAVAPYRALRDEDGTRRRRHLATVLFPDPR